MAERLYRFKRLVGGPADGEWVADAAFEQPSPKGLSIITSLGAVVHGPLPSNVALEPAEYHARTVTVMPTGAGLRVEAFIWDQIAYHPKSIEQLEEWLVKEACDH